MPTGKHLSRGPKIAFLIGALCVIGIGVLIALGEFEQKSEPAAGENNPPPAVTETVPFVPPAPTDTVQVGALDFSRNAQGQDEGYLVQHGEVRTKLIMDEHSYCNIGSGGLQCMAMSISFNTVLSGRRALIDGNREGDAILVRRMRVVDGDEVPPEMPAGTVYISWMQARTLILSCSVASLMQNHEGLVFVTTKDGQKFTAVEPVIDEVFSVAHEATAACGNIQLATE